VLCCWCRGRSRFPIALAHSKHGGVFPVTVVNAPLIGVVHAPAQYYSFVTPQTEDLFHVSGWATDEDPLTTEGVLLAWSWARLVAPSVAEALGTDCKPASDLASLEVVLTTGTPWRSVSGSSCAAATALAFLVHYVPGVGFKDGQATTGAIHLGGGLTGVARVRLCWAVAWPAGCAWPRFFVWCVVTWLREEVRGGRPPGPQDCAGAARGQVPRLRLSASSRSSPGRRCCTTRRASSCATRRRSRGAWQWWASGTWGAF
jgi:hypothetical protein